MIDYHLHLVPHGTRRRFSADDVRAYARRAADAGLVEIALTEHLYRFPDVQDALGAWWEGDPDRRLRDQTLGYLGEERFEQTLAEYVDVVLAAAADPGAGVTIRLGLEVDYIEGHMERVADVLAPHGWDVLLGAVHWLGAWGFDQVDDGVVMEEWSRRRPEDAWLAYVEAVEQVAASGACDVLAHVDLAKVAGVRAGTVAAECDERLAKAAAANRLAVEVSSAGWRKPVGEAYPSPSLLAALHAGGVPVTLATDAHDVGRVGERIDDAAELARGAGYGDVVTFERRKQRPLALGPEPGGPERARRVEEPRR